MMLASRFMRSSVGIVNTVAGFSLLVAPLVLAILLPSGITGL